LIQTIQTGGGAVEFSSPAPLVGLLRRGHCGAGMTQASGKSGRYRYYKCTTRLNKNVDACTAKNLPREQTDRMEHPFGECCEHHASDLFEHRRQALE
jgi:Recombinase zinc beta ribbon domain